MENKEKTSLEEQSSSSKFAEGHTSLHGNNIAEFEGFSSRKEMMLDSLQRYWESSKVMMLSSASHLRSPATIIIIITLIAIYILLGYAGTIGFSFFNSQTVQYVKTNLDIIVNALLGYYFGPITSALSVSLCTSVRMILEAKAFVPNYFISAAVAGFLHGWILYRYKTIWFGTRFRGFFTDLLAKVVVTRVVISTLVNILLSALLYIMFFNSYTLMEYLMHYPKSGVPLESGFEFFAVFILSLCFEVLIVFVALVVINFIISKAFPSQMKETDLFVDDTGAMINPEEETFF